MKYPGRGEWYLPSPLGRRDGDEGKNVPSSSLSVWNKQPLTPAPSPRTGEGRMPSPLRQGFDKLNLPAQGNAPTPSPRTGEES